MNKNDLISRHGPDLSIGTGGYAVVLTCVDKDRHRHNTTFADELSPGLISRGVDVRCLDYIRDIRQVSNALQDPACLFFVCFNGFGSELMVNLAPGHLLSTFDHHSKPLFDLMHDCPVHETMAHQIDSTGSYRQLLITDHSYAHLARVLGVRSVHTVPSITFPKTVGDSNAPLETRSINILLPVGLSNAAWTTERFGIASNYRSRVFREIFAAVTERASDDLQLDPLIETLLAFQEVPMPADLRDPDVRFLITSILDYVKFERRDRLIRHIQHLPVTVIADRNVRDVYKDTQLKFVEQQSFPDLIATMSNAKTVICPLPHHTGFHEHALSAFSAGAAVIAAPNEVLESNFTEEREILGYQSHQHLAALLEDCLAGKVDLQSIASRGREKAMSRFAPGRIAEIILSRYVSAMNRRSRAGTT
ncbi:glycosyltransferase [Paraburkholderia dilworthii]|uniref:Glycosyltransferase n=1 Tax=Paraburkholderia dilworthii TaxID=948106 RepID=A0ABW9DAM0_9BURK